MNWNPISVPELGSPPEPYEYAIQSGSTIYLAGQVALDNKGEIVGTTTEEQSRKAWENISTVLAAAGSSVQDIVKVTYYLADIRELKEEMKVRREILNKWDGNGLPQLEDTKDYRYKLVDEI